MKSGTQYRYHQKDCEFCGRGFEAAYYSAKYCSDKCKVAAHRAKKKNEDYLSDGYRKIWHKVADVSPDAMTVLRSLYDQDNKDALRDALRVAKYIMMDLGHWDEE